jgi:hypothetical protein
MTLAKQLDLYAPRLTLAEARAQTLAAARDGGVVCPCCGRFVRVYRRRLHAEMARFMILLYRRGSTSRSWHSTREVLGDKGGNKASTDATYLVHWGLVERAAAENAAGAPAGHLRLTPLGVAFVERRATAPSHMTLLNNEPAPFAGEEPEVGIEAALGKRFSYDDLMGRAG